MGRTIRVINAAWELGEAQRKRPDPLPTLALMVSKAAKQKQITADDANDIYAAYLGKKEAELTDSFKANASKLRKVIEAADPELVEKVIELRNKLNTDRVRPAYAAIVDACRAQLAGKKLSQAAIKQILTR